MMNPIYTFEARARREDGSIEPFSLAVSKAHREDEHCWYAMLACEFLRKEPFKMYGVDEAQALSLAVDFTRRSLQYDNVQLIDDQGRPIEIPERPYQIDPSDEGRE